MVIYFRLNFIFLFCISLLLIACSGTNKKSKLPIQQLLDQQIMASCEREGQWIKSVTNFQTEEEAEVQTFDQLQIQTEQDSLSCLLSGDLEYGLELYYGADQLKDLYDISQSQDTFIATKKRSSGSSNRLWLQKIKFNRDSTSIVYLESLLNRESWLYDTKIHIGIHFDSLGYYQKHWTESFMAVRGMDQKIHARIEARFIPAP